MALTAAGHVASKEEENVGPVGSGYQTHGSIQFSVNGTDMTNVYMAPDTKSPQMFPNQPMWSAVLVLLTRKGGGGVYVLSGVLLFRVI